METKDTLSSCSNSEERQMQQIQDKSKKSCMVSFRKLHSHLKLLSHDKLKETRTESGFKRAFATLFGQDVETFIGTMFLNVDQLEKQLDKEEFQEIGSMISFKVLEKQFQMFIKSRMYLDDEFVVMTRNYFLKYTQLSIPEFRDTLILHTTEDNVDSSKALDASLVDTESSETALKEQDTSSRSGNDANADDAYIRPIYDEEPMAEEKGFAIAALKNELRKLTGNSVNTKFAKSSILGKSVFQPHRNQSVVRQPTAFKSERPRFSKQRFASQVDVNNDLSKPVTTHYLPKERESVVAKSHHMIAPSSSRYSSNDKVHNHYLEEAKKKTQESCRNSEPSVMPSARSQSTANGSKPKPRINNQKSRNCPVSKSSYVTTKTVPIAKHSRNSRSFSHSKHFVCSTCQKCVFNANLDSCVTKFPNEVNSRAKVPSNKTTKRYIPVEQTSFAKKPERWKPTGKIFKTVGLRWVPTGKIFTSSTTKVDSEPSNGSNDDSAGTLNIHAGTSLNPTKEGLRVWLLKRLISEKPGCSSQAVNKSPTHYPCDSARTFRVILFSIHNDEWKSFQCHHQTALRSYALSWKPCQGDSLNLPDHRIHKDGDGDASFQLKSVSLPYAHAHSTKTFYKHQDSRIIKAQKLKTKTSANSDVNDNSSEIKLRGRLLKSFQDDAKYEHVGQDTRSQGGKDVKDKQG
ncbi:hypothetical protein Tco_0821512 [Tanacetum coccineum]|uniref:Uncharacterized protein n=1 Tax=Tanacetum coccineum TaxID=301880 RepID=A0ABQ5AGK2_9ASTR